MLMKRVMWRPLLLACALFAFSACDKEDGERTESRVKVVLDANAIELTVGETHTLTAQVTPEAEAGASVVWASANPEVAVVDAGVVTAVGAGETTVTASVGESSAACRVTVTEPEPEPEPSEPKVGDYFYSDGTWSDGGLVSIEADGLNPVWADEKPAPVAGKQVIGIVFQTNPERMAASDVEAGYTHGYVVAVRFAHGADKMTTYWSKDWEFSCLDAAKLAETWYANVNGYVETMTVRDNYGETLDEMMPAFGCVLNDFSLPAPEHTSGWFLPSTGQLWDMAANLCGDEVARYMKEWQTLSYDATWYCSETVSYDAMARFNETLSKIPEAERDLLVNDDETHPFCSLWASTPYDSESACILEIGSEGLIECMTNWYDADCFARPILAF